MIDRNSIVVLGLDPGSRVTGYGLLICDDVTHNYRYLASGCIKVNKDSLGERLVYIYQQVYELVERYAPQEVAIEQVFVKHNPDSAIKLGQARGAAIAAALSAGACLAEYTARAVKQAVVGHGGADKAQVQMMVRLMLGLAGATKGGGVTASADSARSIGSSGLDNLINSAYSADSDYSISLANSNSSANLVGSSHSVNFTKYDESDALAVAICHAHSRKMQRLNRR